MRDYESLLIVMMLVSFIFGFALGVSSRNDKKGDPPAIIPMDEPPVTDYVQLTKTPMKNSDSTPWAV